MPIKTDPFVFTGTQEDLTCYVSKGKNILRKRTSLDGERVKKDPAFKGFRNSSNRMRKASPIAASLYAMVPPKHRQYPLYRILTGAALNLIKLGVCEDEIIRILKKEHIDPLIDTFLKTRHAVVTPRPEGTSPFSYGTLSTNTAPSRNTHRIRSRRQAPRTSAALPLTSRKANVRYLPGTTRTPHKHTPDTLHPPHLIYLGRLDDASKLRMYQRPDMGLIIGFNSTPFNISLNEPLFPY